MPSNFVNLHCHGHHSQLDGIGKAEDYASRAAQLGQKALGITDHGNIDGILKHQKACAKQGITPVLGCEMYVCQDMAVKDNQRFHICAYVRSDKGLTNLMKMLSLANLEGFYKRPRVDPKTLLAHAEGLVFSTACVGSFINMSNGADLLMALRDRAPTYLEIMPHAHQKQKEHNQKCFAIGQRHNIPLVATNDCHYPFPGMEETQEVLLAMQRKARWSDKDRWHMRDWPGLHLRSADEMDRAFREQSCLEPSVWQDAMERTAEVAELCEGYTVGRVPVELPKVHGYEDRDETELMWEIINRGWNQRLVMSHKSVESLSDFNVELYSARVNEEFDLICQQGFQRYFLIVWELIDWCKKQGIMTGPGRGSSGGSLICYLMGITDIDPIKWGTIFARFISPERVDYPDIDMDFESSRRQEVIQHLRDCYGEHNVVNISTFTSMKGKGALQAVGRVFGCAPAEGIQASKDIDDVHEGADGYGTTIKDALKQNRSRLLEFQRKYPQVVKHAANLEGQISGYGKHAAGMCINATDLRQGHHCTLRIYNDTLTANWGKDDAEHMGMMKFDVLGVYNLSYLNEAARLVKERRGTLVEFDRLPLDDPEVYKEIAAGNTVGAFQIGSDLNIRWCKDLGVREFNDIVLINALTRPGPLGAGISNQFLARRQGRERIEYIHPRLEPYTRDTLGLVVFQEQVMWAMYELAGLSWGECDKVRKVIGKSKGAAAFLQFKQRFMDGCAEQSTLSAVEADHAWDMMASFGSYAFNLSHAIEYSMLGYWCMYFKVRWPLEFLCGCLSHCKKEESGKYIDEARRLGIEIELPKSGVSLAKNWLPKDGSLWAPLMAIKTVGEAQATKILTGKFKERPVSQKKDSTPALRGFFDKEIVAPQQAAESQPVQQKPGGKMAELLETVGYYREKALTYDQLKDASPHFDFNVMTGAERFATLGKNLAGHSDRELEGCNLRGNVNLIQIGRYILPPIRCRACELINECTRPVQPSFGRHRLMIVGEAPGRDEDREGMGFVGDTGNNILWPELARYGLTPFMFHVTNVVKCWPQRTRTPGKKHIAACAHHLEAEIEGLRPVMILAFGNTNLQFFRGEGSGITKMVEQRPVEWSDKHQCWICWSIHPSAVLHSAGNRSLFEQGIETFAKKLAMIGGHSWAGGAAHMGDNWRIEYPGACPYGGDFGFDNNKYAVCRDCQEWERCAKATAMTSDWMGLS